MRARDGAEFLGLYDPGKAHEVLHRVFVGTPGLRIGQVGEPLDFGWHLGEPVELVSREKPGNTGGRDLGRQLVDRICCIGGKGRAARRLRPAQAARPKICCTKACCAGMSSLGTARTCPLASIAIASMPANVRFAVQKP